MAIPSWAGSLALHAAALAALLLYRSTELLPAPKFAVTSIDVLPPKPLTAPPARKAVGGGGGNHDKTPASRGRLPRVAELVFTPPTVKPAVLEPALPMEPTIAAAPPIQVSALALGDPFGVPGPPSNGRGSRGGIGDGDGGGVGGKSGPRAGKGDDLNGAYALGSLSQPPVLIHKVEPEYSDEARRARYRGMVVLRIVVGVDGVPTRLEVLRSPGLGLDERALKAVSQWRFRPGRRDNKPVPVWANVEVSFSLL